jgi:hypothetical protein
MSNGVELTKDSYDKLKAQLKAELKTELKDEIAEAYFADFGRGTAKRLLYLLGALMLVLLGAQGSAQKLAEHVLK